ncbi:hypothetical protein [Segeticoccus rhizosphaerae]|jgi:hypothetical protein|uniref:hypothetical protein n=1 Tax=Segeticoccus rhizosphaerae TaxID=1104777 RepID=UPI0010C08EC0|nr:MULTISPECIES: hypothetical protein [Intrasporangiaceae]
MTTLTRTRDRLLRATFSGRHRLREMAERPDRGDVPGWVLVTLMTAGLVTMLWALAGPMLADIVRNALSSVKGP